MNNDIIFEIEEIEQESIGFEVLAIIISEIVRKDIELE